MHTIGACQLGHLTYLEMVDMAVLQCCCSYCRAGVTIMCLNHHDVQVIMQPLSECCPEHVLGLQQLEQRRHCFQNLSRRPNGPFG
jgi:hypothetical protein